MSLGIILIGALGRMGKEIAEIIFSDNDLYLQGAIEAKNHPLQGKNFSSCIGKSANDVVISDSLANLNCSNSICIDFSSQSSLRHHLPLISDKKVPLVIGTTGLTSDDITFVKSFASSIPLLISPNMSLGVNLLFYLTEILASRLQNTFDIEIIEMHHRFKKDSPSGTAKHLGEIIANSFGQDYKSCIKNGRKGLTNFARSPQEIGMHAVRGGDIIGDHTVLFAGIGERIELKHMAHNRSTFARGALFAAKWLINKKPGIYSYHDILGF